MISAVEPTTGLALGVAALIVLGLLGVHSLLLVEAIRQIADIRHHMDIDDRPRSYSLGHTAGQRLEELVSSDVRRRFPRIGDLFDANGLLLFLSSDCTTCRSVAEGLPDVIARHELEVPVLVVVDAHLDERRATFLDSTQLDREGVIQDTGDLAFTVGVSVRPTVLTIRDGRLTDAATVTTATQVARIVQTLVDERSHHDILTGTPVGVGRMSD